MNWPVMESEKLYRKVTFGLCLEGRGEENLVLQEGKGGRNTNIKAQRWGYGKKQSVWGPASPNKKFHEL